MWDKTKKMHRKREAIIGFEELPPECQVGVGGGLSWRPSDGCRLVLNAFFVFATRKTTPYPPVEAVGGGRVGFQGVGFSGW